MRPKTMMRLCLFGALVVILVGLVGSADEGVHRTWITIGSYEAIPLQTPDACWDQLVAMQLTHSVRQAVWIQAPESACVDWPQFNETVLPHLISSLAAEAERFGALIGAVENLGHLLEDSGSLDTWEHVASTLDPTWPTWPKEFGPPWFFPPWPWIPCCLHALDASGIADTAGYDIASHGGFDGLMANEPETLGQILADAILEVADFLSAPTTQATTQRIATHVVPLWLSELADDSELLDMAQGGIDTQSGLDDLPEISLTLSSMQDDLDDDACNVVSDRTLLIIQTAASVIAAGAALAGLCM